jgi:micrococcal nuclease
MGDIIPFRRRKGRPPRLPGNRLAWRSHAGNRSATGKSSLRRWLSALRPWLFLTIALLIWPTMDPALVEAPAFLSSDPEAVQGSFSRCGIGRSLNCVVDGDTFKLGTRKVRIVGIDAPETHQSQCEAEAQLGEAATAELQRLLNQGAFTMTGRIDGMQDRYGRDLRALSRVRADGTSQSIAADMIASGTVRRYLGGLRGGWC